MTEVPISSTTPPRPWEYSAFPVAVARKRQLTSGFVRITFAGESLRGFAPWGLDQRIKLVLPMPDGTTPDFGLRDTPPHPKQWYTRWKALPEHRRNVLRTYTPSAIHPRRGRSTWTCSSTSPPAPPPPGRCTAGPATASSSPARTSAPATPGRHPLHPPAPPRSVHLIGDESALPAINNILTALPPSASADVIAELADLDDNTLTPGASAQTIDIVQAGAQPGNALEATVEGWIARVHPGWQNTPDTYAWIAGEAAATSSIRRRLIVDLGLSKEQVAFLGYWKLGSPLVGRRAAKRMQPENWTPELVVLSGNADDRTDKLEGDHAPPARCAGWPHEGCQGRLSDVSADAGCVEQRIDGRLEESAEIRRHPRRLGYVRRRRSPSADVQATPGRLLLRGTRPGGRRLPDRS